MQNEIKKHFGIVGAGLSGCVLAHKLSEAGNRVTVFDSRSHIAGNCYTERCPKTNILIHRYGPHIFHTDNKLVWDFVNQYANFKPFINRVKTTHDNRVYSLPINLHTINQYFGKNLNPKKAQEYVNALAKGDITNPQTFEEQALAFVGKSLYDTFLYGYTIKQWGIHPSELPASILKRLPVRFNYDDNYFNHKYQGIPENGYTEICEKLLSNPKISVHLETKFDKTMRYAYDHIFFTGPIDSWFDYDFGRLGYRTLQFIEEHHSGDYQGCAVMNYAEEGIPYTRITEHKHFAPWEKHDKTIIFKEYSKFCEEGDIPYYPIRLINEKTLLNRYIDAALTEKNVSFLGRLGTYRYLDMDVTIQEALDAANTSVQLSENAQKIPAFFTDIS